MFIKRTVLDSVECVHQVHSEDANAARNLDLACPEAFFVVPKKMIKYSGVFKELPQASVAFPKSFSCKFPKW